jgi:hypothetical protein
VEQLVRDLRSGRQPHGQQQHADIAEQQRSVVRIGVAPVVFSVLVAKPSQDRPEIAILLHGPLRVQIVERPDRPRSSDIEIRLAVVGIVIHRMCGPEADRIK